MNIDAGDPLNAPDHDIDGILRPIDGDALNGSEYDIGAHEYANFVPNITLTPPTTQITNEAGLQAVFTAVLDSPPTGTVTLAVSSSDTTEGTVAPAVLILYEKSYIYLLYSGP